MDIGHERDIYGLPDAAQISGRHVRHGDADDLAARVLQALIWSMVA